MEAIKKVTKQLLDGVDFTIDFGSTSSVIRCVNVSVSVNVHGSHTETEDDGNADASPSETDDTEEKNGDSKITVIVDFEGNIINTIDDGKHPEVYNDPSVQDQLRNLAKAMRPQ